MEQKKFSRRGMLKLGATLTATALVAKALKPLNTLAADSCDDSGIKMQNYISDAKSIKASDKAYAKFKSSEPLVAEAAKKAGKKAEGLIPHCANCKFYKEKSNGCGTCPMVGASGTPGKMVKSTGFCSVYTLNPSLV